MDIVKLKLQAEIYHSFKIYSESIFHYNCGILSLYVEPLPIKNNRDGPKLSSPSPVPNPKSKPKSTLTQIQGLIGSLFPKMKGCFCLLVVLPGIGHQVKVSSPHDSIQLLPPPAPHHFTGHTHG